MNNVAKGQVSQYKDPLAKASYIVLVLILVLGAGGILAWFLEAVYHITQIIATEGRAIIGS